MVTDRLKSFLGFTMPRMLRVAMVLVRGAGMASGVGEGEGLDEEEEVEEIGLADEVGDVGPVAGEGNGLVVVAEGVGRDGWVH